jgi:hypothetical protein
MNSKKSASATGAVSALKAANKAPLSIVTSPIVNESDLHSATVAAITAAAVTSVDTSTTPAAIVAVAAIISSTAPLIATSSTTIVESDLNSSAPATTIHCEDSIPKYVGGTVACSDDGKIIYYS